MFMTRLNALAVLEVNDVFACVPNLQLSDLFDYFITNDNLQDAYKQLKVRQLFSCSLLPPLPLLLALCPPPPHPPPPPPPTCSPSPSSPSSSLPSMFVLPLALFLPLALLLDLTSPHLQLVLTNYPHLEDTIRKSMQT